MTAEVDPRHTGLSMRHRLAERGVDGQLLLLLPAMVFVIGLFIYPFLYGLGLSFQPAKGGGAFADYQRFFSDSFQRDTIWKTLRLSVPAALFNVLASVPIAYRMRGRFRGKRLVTTLLVVPITLGTVLTAQGLLNFLGPAGWFNRTLIERGLRRRAAPAHQQLLGRLLLARDHRFPVRLPADPVLPVGHRPHAGTGGGDAGRGLARSGSAGSPCRCWRRGWRRRSA